MKDNRFIRNLDLCSRGLQEHAKSVEWDEEISPQASPAGTSRVLHQAHPILVSRSE